MKIVKKSFLFFLFTSMLLLSNAMFSQQKTDSTALYIHQIAQSNTPDILTNAYTFFKKQLAFHTKKKHPEKAAYYLFYLSKIDYKVGFYNDSESSAVQALSLLEPLKNSKSNKALLKALYNHLGKVYREKEIPEKAIKMYQKALALTQKPKDSLVLYNNMSNLFSDQKQYATSQALLLQATAMFQRVNDTIEKARVLDNLGRLELHQENPEKALNYLNQALALKKQTKFNSSRYASYKNIAQVYAAKKDTTKAISYALQAKKVANRVNSLSYKIDATKQLMQLEYPLAAREYILLTDSLNQIKKHNTNTFALLKYDVSKSELQSQKEKLKKQQYQFIALIIFLIGTFLFFVLKNLHRKEKMEEIYATETRISKKVHDEVANDVYQIMTKLQNTETPNEALLDDLEHIYTKTRDISKEHSTIDVDQDFQTLITDLLASYKSNTVNVITKGVTSIAWQQIPALKRIAIYRVLQELMTNMKKHSAASLVVIVCTKQNKKLHINYRDNGVGCTLKKYNGLQNAENRIQAIQGTITFDARTNAGFKANIIV